MRKLLHPVLGSKDTLPDETLSASLNAVAARLQGYLPDSLNCRAGSFLEDIDNLNAEVAYRQTLEASVAYMMMFRLSINVDNYIVAQDISNLYASDTSETNNAFWPANLEVAHLLRLLTAPPLVHSTIDKL
ncbi:hypothetical protein [Oscillibacter sp.]|uniref:hypothetical protein n=1 Tax=Oscillibacter sp. TaxID=1945593 RepID=UPI0028A11782|nr:hypothetical protein [Oscillibacter sp.]